MHAPTHLMSGWCVGNLFRLTAVERVFCMIAASAADVDAVSRVFWGGGVPGLAPRGRA